MKQFFLKKVIKLVKIKFDIYNHISLFSIHHVVGYNTRENTQVNLQKV